MLFKALTNDDDDLRFFVYDFQCLRGTTHDTQFVIFNSKCLFRNLANKNNVVCAFACDSRKSKQISVKATKEICLLHKSVSLTENEEATGFLAGDREIVPGFPIVVSSFVVNVI